MLNIDMNANLYAYNGNIKIEYLDIDVYFDETSWNTREMFVSIIQISLNTVRVSEYFCNY